MSQQPQRGFSLVEVMIAIGIITVGLLGLLALFTQAVAVSKSTGDDLIAKQMVRESLEGIYTARNTRQIDFSAIRNAASGGLFADGFQPVRTSGPDGLPGTDDDGEVVTMYLAGDDGIAGTADDEAVLLDRYEREIRIDGINDDLRKISITVRYPTASGLRRSYQVSSYVSRFR